MASQVKPIFLHRGKEVEGKIISKTETELILDLGSKSDGVLSARELPKEQFSTLKIGDKIKVFVVETENEAGQTVVSTHLPVRPSRFPERGKKGRQIDWDRFTTASDQNTQISAKVVEINKGGLIVEVDGARGFLPNSQIGFELIKKMGSTSDITGQDLTVLVSEVDTENNRLIFTQKGLVSDQVKSSLAEYKNGQKVTGKIAAILPFGLFVAVDSVGGLVFIGDVAWEKVEDLTKLYKVGDEVQVVVTGIDNDLGRLNLSIKQLQQDPFTKLAEKYPVDEAVKGTVVDVNPGGVSVKLEDGTEGFIQPGKLGDTSYEAGQSTTFLVDSIDSKRRRLNLTPLITSTAGLIYK